MSSISHSINDIKSYLLDPPEVKIETTWEHVAEGDSIDIKCKVEANPEPKVRSPD